MELFKSKFSRHALNTTANHTVGVKYTQGRYNQLRWDQWLVHHQVYFIVNAVGVSFKCDSLIHKAKKENRKTHNSQNCWSKLSIMQLLNSCLFIFSERLTSSWPGKRKSNFDDSSSSQRSEGLKRSPLPLKNACFISGYNSTHLNIKISYTVAAILN